MICRFHGSHLEHISGSKRFLCLKSPVYPSYYPVHVFAASYVYGRFGLCMYEHVCVCMYMWPKTACLRSYRLKISHWCNLLLACRV